MRGGIRGVWLAVGLGVLGCAEDLVLADGETHGTAESTEDGDSTGASESDQSESLDEAETGETGEDELVCGQCANPWVHVGDLEISPDRVVALPPCLTEIDGDLRILDVVDPERLDGLEHVARVTGELLISSTELHDLSPLGCLTELGEHGLIGNNAALTNLHGLEQLTAVGTLRIENNPALTSIHGLPLAVESTGHLTITHSPLLAQLDGFESSGWASVRIAYCDGLTDLDGLEAEFSGVSSMGLQIDHLAGLTSLSGLEGLVALPSLTLEALPALAGLEPLAGLELVEGPLRLAELPHLTDLASLSSLAQIGPLTISDNVGLTSVDGLVALTQVETVSLRDNPILTDFWGLMPAAASATSISLYRNSALTGVDELTGVTELGTLTLSDCDAIASLAGLAALTSIDSLRLDGNAAVNSLAGVEQLLDADAISIVAQSQITSLAPLAQLESLGDLTLMFTGITDLAPLTGLTTLDDVTLMSNSSLTSLTGLEQLVSVGNLQIFGNPALLGLQPLAQLSVVTGDLVLRSNPAIVDLDGLGALETIAGQLILGGCQGSEFNRPSPVGTPSLTSLVGLDALTEIGGLAVIGNGLLTSLTGAPNLTTIGDGGVGLFANPNLSLPAIESFLAGVTVAGEVTLCDEDPDCDLCAGQGPQ